MTENITPAADTLQRRVDDMPLPGHSLDWGEDGSPLPPSSIVHLYRPLDERHRLWSEIKTQELLAYVQAAPDRFELRTLFTVPVDDLARSQLVPVMDARLRLDRMNAAARQAVAGIYEAIDLMNQMREKP